MHDRSAVALPEPIAEFTKSLRAAMPEVSLEVDRPADPKGEWWLDLASNGFKSSVAWRPDHGFGVFTSERGYTDQPDEVYRQPELATKRIRQLLGHWKESSKLQPLSLADIRQLRETRQTALAAALEVNQGAVSRFENREDMKLSSLHSYFRAMGGRLELRVHFDSFDAAVSVPSEEKDTDEESA